MGIAAVKFSTHCPLRNFQDWRFCLYMGMYEINKTRDHFVPQFYLRGFSIIDHPTQIYVFDKHKPEAGVEVRSIHDIEVSRDAYSAANDEILTEREKHWSQILNILKRYSVAELNEHISDRESSARLRAWLARFVVDSKLRSRGFREEMRETLMETRLVYLKMHEASKADFLKRFPDSDEEIQAVFSASKEMVGLDNDRKFSAILVDPFIRGEEGERWYRWYEEGSWRFNAAPEGRKFITSDIPSTSLLLGPEPEYRNWMFFTMPLSAELQLIGFCGDARIESGLAPRAEEIGDEEMNLANVCVFQSAERFVYSSSKTEIIRAR